MSDPVSLATTDLATADLATADLATADLAAAGLATAEQRQAYLLLRLVIGLDFFMHGFARIFIGAHLAGFAHGMVKTMAAAPLPASLTLAGGYTIPCVEFLIGSLLLLGLFTRFALTLALLLMLVLMLGVGLKQDWATAATQLLYGLVLAVLLFLQERYDLSWRGLVRSGGGR